MPASTPVDADLQQRWPPGSLQLGVEGALKHCSPGYKHACACGGCTHPSCPRVLESLTRLGPLPTMGCLHAQKCLICGWAESNFMSDVLRELDRGPSALPPGTHVTLCNMHDAAALAATMRQWRAGAPRNLRLHHVRANPLHRHQLQQVP